MTNINPFEAGAQPDNTPPPEQQDLDHAAAVARGMLDPSAQAGAAKDRYPEPETPNCQKLRKYLDAAFQQGEIRGGGGSSVVDVDDSLRRMAADRIGPDAIQPDAQQISIPTVESYDHATTVNHYEQAGLTATLVGRHSYVDGIPVEPYRIGITLGNKDDGGIVLDITIPSRATETNSATDDSPLSPDEARPPHATMRLVHPAGDGQAVDMSRIFERAIQATREPLSSGSMSADTFEGRQRSELLERLPILRELIQKLDTGRLSGKTHEQTLDDEALKTLNTFCQLEFPV